MRWDCMTKALRFLQITAEYQVGQFLKLKLKLKPLQGPNLAWDCLWAARLAQSVEHQTFNLRVMGSSPISGDFPFYEFSRLCFDFFWARKWLMYHMKYAKESAYIHTYIHDFILYRIFRVAQTLISSREEKNANNKITLLSNNYISVNAYCYERRWLVLDVETSQSGLRSNVLR